MGWAGGGESLRLWCSAEIAVGVQLGEMSTGAVPILLPVMRDVTDGEGEC